jgi:hypothetical protein
MDFYETFFISLGIKPNDHVIGNSTDSANMGYLAWYSDIAPGESPSANFDDLLKSFYTKWKKDIIEFDFNDSGKTAYFAVHIENEGKKGNWGPIVSTLIPK